MTDLRPTPRLIQALRCVRLLLHFLWTVFFVATAYPFIRESRRLWLKQNWSRQLLEILGVQLDRHLSGIASGTLIVANHNFMAGHLCAQRRLSDRLRIKARDHRID